MIKFTKMHGLGNDYVYIDAINQNIENESFVDNALKRLQIEYALALGIKSSETLNKLIEEVYQ